MRQKYEDRREIVFVLQDWDDGYNVGSMFRLAEGMGAAELILTGRTPQPELNPMVAVTSMGQHRRVPWRHFDKHVEAVQRLISDGFVAVAVEIADGAVDFTEFEWPEKCCLILGNEGAGVYDSVSRLCEASVFIPMFGKGRSHNVVAAAAIIGYAATLSPTRVNDIG